MDTSDNSHPLLNANTRLADERLDYGKTLEYLTSLKLWISVITEPDGSTSHDCWYWRRFFFRQKPTVATFEICQKADKIRFDHSAKLDDGLEQLKRLTELDALVRCATNSPTSPWLGAIVKWIPFAFFMWNCKYRKTLMVRLVPVPTICIGSGRSGQPTFRASAG